MSLEFIRDNIAVIRAWEAVRNEDTLKFINVTCDNFIDGVEYEVAPSQNETSCVGCCFEDNKYGNLSRCYKVTCLRRDRIDGADVVFIKPLTKGLT